MGSSPVSGSVLCQHGACLEFSLSVSLPLPQLVRALSLSLSFKINKLKKKTHVTEAGALWPHHIFLYTFYEHIAINSKSVVKRPKFFSLLHHLVRSFLIFVHLFSKLFSLQFHFRHVVRMKDQMSKALCLKTVCCLGAWLNNMGLIFWQSCVSLLWC